MGVHWEALLGADVSESQGPRERRGMCQSNKDLSVVTRRKEGTGPAVQPGSTIVGEVLLCVSHRFGLLIGLHTTFAESLLRRQPL